MLSFLGRVPVTRREFNDRQPDFLSRLISQHTQQLCQVWAKSVNWALSRPPSPPPGYLMDTLLTVLNSDLLTMRLDTGWGLAYPQKLHHCKSIVAWKNLCWEVELQAYSPSNMARGFENVCRFAACFRIKNVKVSKKVEQKLFIIKKNWGKRGQKRYLATWKSLNWGKSSQKLSSVFWRNERLTGLKIFCFEKVVRDKVVVFCA